MHHVLRRRLLALALCAASSLPLHALLTYVGPPPAQSATQDDHELSDGDVDAPADGVDAAPARH